MNLSMQNKYEANAPFPNLKSDVLTFLADTLLNKNISVYQPVNSPVFCETMSKKKDKALFLPRLEIPKMPSHIIDIIESQKKVQSKKDFEEQEISKKTAVKEANRKSNSSIKNVIMVTPLELIDGIKYDPEDFNFSKKTFSPKREKKEKAGKKIELPLLKMKKLKEKSKKTFALVMGKKEDKTTEQQKRLVILCQNDGFKQTIQNRITSLLAPNKKRCISVLGEPNQEITPKNKIRIHHCTFQYNKGIKGKRNTVVPSQSLLMFPIDEIKKQKTEANKYGIKRLTEDLNEMILKKEKKPKELVSNTLYYQKKIEECITDNPDKQYIKNIKNMPSDTELPVLEENLYEIKKGTKSLKKLKKKYEIRYEITNKESELFGKKYSNPKN